MKIWFETDKRGREKLFIEDAELIFTNFAGREKKFNAEGKRNFCVYIDNDTAKYLEEKHYTIKWDERRNPDDDPVPFIRVNIKYNEKFPQLDPEAYKVTSRGATPVREENIGDFDMEEMENVNLIINLYTRENEDGSVSTTGYLNSIVAKIEENPFLSGIAIAGEELMDDVEELPF